MLVDYIEIMKKIFGDIGFTCLSVNADPNEYPPLDRGIRRALFPDMEGPFVDFLIKNREEGVIYYIQDYFLAEYALLRIPESERAYGDYLIVGPYLGFHMNDARLVRFMEQNAIPISYMEDLREYYHVLPEFPNPNSIHQFFQAMASILYNGQNLLIEFAEWQDTDLSPRPENANHRLMAFRQIEERYHLSQELITAVCAGDQKKAMELLQKTMNYRIEPRYTGTDLEYKSTLISTNTSLCSAVERAGIHPFYADQLSERIAGEIAGIHDKSEAAHLMESIIRKYCQLVNNYSLSDYSPLIQKVINRINLNLDGNIALKDLADEFSTNRSYLSTLFKKETGVTFSAYVNQQRIRKSLLLLNTTNLPVSEIAAECGIYDVNYFRRLFKKQIGVTPSEYAKQVRKKF